MVERFVLTSSRFPLRKSEKNALLLRLELTNSDLLGGRMLYPLDTPPGDGILFAAVLTLVFYDNAKFFQREWIPPFPSKKWGEF